MKDLLFLVFAVGLSGVAAARAEDVTAIAGDFSLVYEENSPGGAFLRFEAGADGGVRYRCEHSLGAETIVTEATHTLEAPRFRRLAGVLDGRYSREYGGGVVVPAFWDIAAGTDAGSSPHWVKITARAGGKETRVTLPYVKIDLHQVQFDRVDPGLAYLRLRLLETSGVAEAVARALFERGRERMKALEADRPEAEDPYGRAQFLFLKGIEVLDQTYDLAHRIRDDTDQTLLWSQNYFREKQFRASAQAAGVVLRDRLGWAESARAAMLALDSGDGGSK